MQQIAKELGLEKTDSLRKEELVYRILDEQAIVEATKKTVAAKSDDNRKEPANAHVSVLRKKGTKSIQLLKTRHKN